MSQPDPAAVGAARSRLAARESFFGGPLSTREASKAPGWKAFVKPAPQPEAAPAGKKGRGGRSADGASKPRAQQPAAPPPDPDKERRQKLRQRRDFSGLDGDAPPPPAAAQRPATAQQPAGAPPRQQQTAAGPPPRQQQAQHQQLHNQQRVTKRAAGGGGAKAAAGRSMAVEVAAGGKARKQVASDALRQRVGELVAQHAGAAGAGRGAHAAPDLGSPSGSGAARGGASGGGGGAAAAARAAREAANAKAVMHKQQFRTAHGMQTLQLVSRPPGAGRGGAGGGGGAALAAMRAGAATSPGARPCVASPGSVSKGAPRPATGAGAPRRLQQQQQQRGQARGAPQFRGAFYGGHQPPAALEGRMRYNKRRLSMDSQEGGSDLDSFIASDEEEAEEGGWSSGGEGGEGGWRAALREATGGYDPSKFAHLDRLPDRGMEAGWNEISAEEKRTLRIARTEDEREAEAEARREAAKRERKEKRKRGVAAFLDDD